MINGLRRKRPQELFSTSPGISGKFAILERNVSQGQFTPAKFSNPPQDAIPKHTAPPSLSRGCPLPGTTPPLSHKRPPYEHKIALSTTSRSHRSLLLGLHELIASACITEGTCAIYRVAGEGTMRHYSVKALSPANIATVLRRQREFYRESGRLFLRVLYRVFSQNTSL